MLGTSRVDPYREPDGIERIHQAMEIHRLDGLIVIGGEGTLSATNRLQQDEGINLIGIPKTIDNDVDITEYTIGFLTAVDTATEAVDRLHSTAESHDRVMVLEVMGRHAGLDRDVRRHGRRRRRHPHPRGPVRHRRRLPPPAPPCRAPGRDFSIVVVAEGAVPVEGTMELPEHPKDEFGRPRLGGIGHTIAAEIEQRTGFEARITQLGHVQRGGTPNPFDRQLATRMGVKAVDTAEAGDWGQMTAYKDFRVQPVPLQDAVDRLKTVPEKLYRVAEVFFG